jgi:hypothetical protein
LLTPQDAVNRSETVQPYEKLHSDDNVAFAENKKPREAADAEPVRPRDNTSSLELFAIPEKYSPREKVNASDTEDSDKVKPPDAEFFSDGVAHCDAVPTFETESP